MVTDCRQLGSDTKRVEPTIGKSGLTLGKWGLTIGMGGCQWQVVADCLQKGLPLVSGG